MEQIDITHYIIDHLQNNAGTSYRNPLKILKKDAGDYVDLEYGIIKAIASALKYKYTVKEQLLLVSKRHKVYDIILVEYNDRNTKKYCFDITDVFCLHS
jgi:hypothetical protein